MRRVGEIFKHWCGSTLRQNEVQGRKNKISWQRFHTRKVKREEAEATSTEVNEPVKELKLAKFYIYNDKLHDKDVLSQLTNIVWS